MINSFELSDRLSRVERMGIPVPVLHHSPYIPKHTETRPDGTEIYSGTRVDVSAGEVIDTDGNVVNLRRLEEKATMKYFENIRPQT